MPGCTSPSLAKQSASELPTREAYSADADQNGAETQETAGGRLTSTGIRAPQNLPYDRRRINHGDS